MLAMMRFLGGVPPRAAGFRGFTVGRRLVRLTLRPSLPVAALCLFPLGEVEAQTLTWGNPGVGAFSDGANWVGGSAPESFDDIVVNNGGTAQVSSTADVSNTTIDGSSTIELLPGDLSYFTPNQVYLGSSGTGTLLIGAQAMAATGDVYAGYGASGNGVITMDGGTLSPYDFYAGYEGTATVTMLNGSTLESTTGWVGWAAGSTGVVNMDASTWTISEQGQPRSLRVGYEGTGTIHATNSQISALSLKLGETNAVASGTLTMNGGTTTIEDAIIVGNVGSGTLALTNGATISSYGLTVGALAGSSGSLSVIGSTLTNSIETFIGLDGNGTLTATNAQIHAKALFVARNLGSVSSATVSGGAMTLTEDLHVGSGGSGTFTLTGQSILQSDIGNVGFEAGSAGVVNISDAEWDNTRAVFIGVHGEGTLNISNSGGVASESGYIAQNAGANGTVNVTSNGAWSMTNTLVVGVKGEGRLSVSGGGQVNAVWSQIGLDPGSGGTVTLSNGMWNTTQTLTIGQQANGSLTAVAGSTLTAGAIEIAGSGLVSGSLHATNSTISTVNIVQGGGSATLQLDGVQLKLLGGPSVLDTLLIDGSFVGNVGLGSGGLTVDTQGGNAQIASVLTGSGALTKTGEGRLRLTTANTYAGGTTLHGGVIEITGNDNLGEGNVSLGTAELRAHTTSTLSGNIGSGIQLISVATNQTGTFSAAAGQTLTLAPMDFLLVAGSTMQIGSGTNTGGVILAPTGAAALTADTAVNVVAGTLTAGNNELEFITSIAASTTVAAGATLDFNDQLTGTGIFGLYGAGTVNTGSSTNTTLNVGSGNFSGLITGQGAFIKSGTGTLTVASGGNINVMGTVTVDAGNLMVNGSIGTGLGSVLVNTGGTLGGTGLIGPVTLAGGTLSPGNSPGTITVADLLWQSGTIVFDLGPTQAQSDLIQTGVLYGEGSSYVFDFQDNGWLEGVTYDLIEFSGTSTLDVGDFSYLNTGGFTGLFSTNSSTLQFTLTAIPEPGTTALLAVAGLAALMLGRGRWSRR